MTDWPLANTCRMPMLVACSSIQRRVQVSDPAHRLRQHHHRPRRLPARLEPERGDGGWPLLYGGDPVSASQLKLAFDEDQVGDSERAHTSEQVACVSFVGQVITKSITSNLARSIKLPFGGQRVAVRRGDVLHYLHGDHGHPCGCLGSTSLTTCGSRGGCGGAERGSVVARRLYHPYGAERYTEGALPTDFTFTGQRKMPRLGLMH